MITHKNIIKALLRRFFWNSFRFFPIDNKKVVMSSYYGKGYGDNPKYIVEELRKNTSDLKIYWIIKDKIDNNTLPNGVIPCIDDTINSIFQLSTSKVWVDNCRKNVFHKKKSQIYIQTWHGFALKKIECDALNSLSDSYIKNAQKDSKRIDLIISDSDFMSKIYKNSFWYKGIVCKWGAPRNDIFFRNNQLLIKKVFTFFSIPKGKKIVLYAPTFRNNNSLEVYTLDYIRLKEICDKRFGGEFVVLIKLHPNIVKLAKNLVFDDKLTFNASIYPDMQELLISSDVVISDYSSLMFDFALSRKPCFQFATDIENYKKDRNFYFKLERLPFTLAKSNDELMNNINFFNEENYLSTLDSFFKKVGMNFEGHASEKVANFIKSYCK